MFDKNTTFERINCKRNKTAESSAVERKFSVISSLRQITVCVFVCIRKLYYFTKIKHSDL